MSDLVPTGVTSLAVATTPTSVIVSSRMCLVCGALVADIQKHSGFHETIKRGTDD